MPPSTLANLLAMILGAADAAKADREAVEMYSTPGSRYLVQLWPDSGQWRATVEDSEIQKGSCIVASATDARPYRAALCLAQQLAAFAARAAGDPPASDQARMAGPALDEAQESILARLAPTIGDDDRATLEALGLDCPDPADLARDLYAVAWHVADPWHYDDDEDSPSRWLDFRLRLRRSGHVLQSGSPDYDQDGRGPTGCATLDLSAHDRLRACIACAAELLDSALEDCADLDPEGAAE